MKMTDELFDPVAERFRVLGEPVQLVAQLPSAVEPALRCVEP